MIRKLYIGVLLIILLGCDNENAFDCVKTVGEIQSYELDLPAFDKVEVFGDIEVIISNSFEQSVVLETGENLFPKISFDVTDGLFTISDDNGCNWARKYKNTTLYINSNKLTEIRNSGARDIKSNGTYELDHKLNLVSKGTSGDYFIDIQGPALNISNNQASNYYITGEVNQLFVGFYSGVGRFEGADLIANNVDFFQRGENDIIVNPQSRLSGSIEAFADVVMVNVPSEIDITYNGTGKLVYPEN